MLGYLVVTNRQNYTIAEKFKQTPYHCEVRPLYGRARSNPPRGELSSGEIASQRRLALTGTCLSSPIAVILSPTPPPSCQLTAAYPHTNTHTFDWASSRTQ